MKTITAARRLFTISLKNIKNISQPINSVRAIYSVKNQTAVVVTAARSRDGFRLRSGGVSARTREKYAHQNCNIKLPYRNVYWKQSMNNSWTANSASSGRVSSQIRCYFYKTLTIFFSFPHLFFGYLIKFLIFFDAHNNSNHRKKIKRLKTAKVNGISCARSVCINVRIFKKCWTLVALFRAQSDCMPKSCFLDWFINQHFAPITQP